MRQQLLKIAQYRRKFPGRFVNFELTNHCNLACPMCSTGMGKLLGPPGFLCVEDFEQAMLKCHRLVDDVLFVGSGEPMLHPDFERFAAIAAKTYGKQTLCRTNGMFMHRPYSLIDSGLHRICVGIDGLSQEVHESYRRGADFSAILEGVRQLVAAKKERRSFWPEIIVTTIVHRHNEHQVEKLVDLARDLGVNGISFSGIMQTHETDDSWLPRDERFEQIEKKTLSCDFSSNILGGVVTHGGDVLLCCMTPLHDRPVVKFNLFEGTQREEDIIHDKRAQKLTAMCGAFEFCGDCSYARYRRYHRSYYFDERSRLLSWRTALRRRWQHSLSSALGSLFPYHG